MAAGVAAVESTIYCRPQAVMRSLGVVNHPIDSYVRFKSHCPLSGFFCACVLVYVRACVRACLHRVLVCRQPWSIGTRISGVGSHLGLEPPLVVFLDEAVWPGVKHFVLGPSQMIIESLKPNAVLLLIHSQPQYLLIFTTTPWRKRCDATPRHLCFSLTRKSQHVVATRPVSSPSVKWQKETCHFFWTSVTEVSRVATNAFYYL